MVPPSSPLWQQLQLVARIIDGVRQGRSLPQQLEQIDSAQRPGVQALSFHALRWLGLAEGVRSQLVRRMPPPLADALLCTSLALALEPDGGRYEIFTLVDQTVEAAKRGRGMQLQAGFINACLRRFVRERGSLTETASRQPVARWNHPAWWVKRLQHDHPGCWQAVLRAAQTASPMDLRVNLRRISVADFCQRLAQAGIGADATGHAAVRLHHARPVREIPGFAEGFFSVQSVAAQRAAPLLLAGLPDAPLRVLDACAAPGGKTAHLLEHRPDLRVTALEIDPVRAGRIADTLERLGLQAAVRVADAGDVASWWRGEHYDAILLDAPCSASGIVSRHPDVRWLRRATDIGQLTQQQDRLLAALWPLLCAGGRLLYCTCSVFAAEGRDRIDAFLAHNNDAQLLPSPGHLLPSTGSDAGTVGDNGTRDDGFYFALLHKRLAVPPAVAVGGSPAARPRDGGGQS